MALVYKIRVLKYNKMFDIYTAGFYKIKAKKLSFLVIMLLRNRYIVRQV